MSFLLQLLLLILDFLTQCIGLLIMFTDLLILVINCLSRTILQLLKFKELLHISIYFPEFNSALLLALVKIEEYPFPVPLCHLMVVVE